MGSWGRSGWKLKVEEMEKIWYAWVWWRFPKTERSKRAWVVSTNGRWDLEWEVAAGYLCGLLCEVLRTVVKISVIRSEAGKEDRWGRRVWVGTVCHARVMARAALAETTANQRRNSTDGNFHGLRAWLMPLFFVVQWSLISNASTVLSGIQNLDMWHLLCMSIPRKYLTYSYNLSKWNQRGISLKIEIITDYSLWIIWLGK